MIYVKVNGVLYPATIAGRTQDTAWDNRASKAITMEGDYATVDALFPNGTPWSIVMDAQDATQEEYDNSEYHIRGDLTVHGNGTCTVKMGAMTELEKERQRSISTVDLDIAYAEGVNEA